MGVYGTYGAFSGLGKPSIKLEFEDNEALLDFQRRMQEGGDNPDGDTPDGGGNFTPSTYTQEQLDNAVKNHTVTGWGIFPEIPDGWQLVKTSAAPKGFNVITKGEPSFEMTTEGWKFKHSLDAALIEKKKGLKVVKGDEEPVEGVKRLTEKEFYNLIEKEPQYINLQAQRYNYTQNSIENIEDSNGTSKPAYCFNTPIEKIYCWVDFFHIVKGNSSGQDRTEILPFIKPTLEDPNCIFENGKENYFIKPFITERGVKIVFAFIPTLKDVSRVKTLFERPKKEIFNKYKKGGGILYQKFDILDGSTALNGAANQSKPFKIVEFRLPCTITENGAKSFVDGAKNSLEGYGDFYTVRDMRKRSRKEPGDVAANKNLQFTKDEGQTIQNFDKDLYLAPEMSPYSFNKEVKGKKYKYCFIDISYRGIDNTREEYYYLNVHFYSPHKKSGKTTFKGYETSAPIEVKLSDFVNLERKGRQFKGYALDSQYKEWFNEALEKQIAAYQRTIRSGNSFAAENAKDLKYLVEYYSNIDKYTAYVMHNYGDPTLLNPATVEEYKRYIDTSIFDGVTLGKTANDALYNNLEILDYRGMQPTYRQLPNYDAFFKPAANKNSLKGWGLNDTKKLIADICRNHYKECAAIAKHLKAETKLQSAFNLWHWLHHNIRYEYDREGREEVRTPARVWADRHRGVDCDCLSVLAWCVLKCMGYNPAFELAAFRNKPAYSHIYINLDGIVVDRVWYVFNSRPPFITKTELFKVGMLDNLGQLF